MITLIKIITGEELIGDIDETMIRTGTLIIRNPLKINYVQREPGIPDTFMSKYILFSNSPTITIDMNHVLLITEPKPGIVRYYTKLVDYYQRMDRDIDTQLDNVAEVTPGKNIPKTEQQELSELFLTILEQMPKNSTPN